MKIICELNDKVLFGEEGLSEVQPMYGVRAILRQADGLYAVMHVEKYHNYATPGGFMEPGEEPLTALKRELLEETGCAIEQAEELGEIRENRAFAGFTKITYFYVVHTNGPTRAPVFTEAEIEEGTQLCWHTLEEAIRLFEDYEPETRQQAYLRARDISALKYYQKNQ